MATADKDSNGNYVRVRTGDRVVIDWHAPVRNPLGERDFRGTPGIAVATVSNGARLRFHAYDPAKQVHIGNHLWLWRAQVRRIRSGNAKPKPFEALPASAGACRAAGDL